MIRRKFPDKAKAMSMLNAAEGDLEVIESIKNNRKAGSLIVRTIYECFRMLGDALLTAEGFETTGIDHHKEMISRLLKINVKTTRPLLVLDELRKERNDINYEGYAPTEDEIKDAIAIKDALWKPVLTEVKRLIERTGSITSD
ncbi:hypothetical protein HYU12_01095 [Candidatus Woesearchaeota archaeon]|nr:hypothetical protein [Candidatus Woesearchaeota archaeon]